VTVGTGITFDGDLADDDPLRDDGLRDLESRRRPKREPRDPSDKYDDDIPF
jgi:hypothetical protein